MYRCDKKERIGGGVEIWVKDSIVSRERGDIKDAFNVEDSIWVEIIFIFIFLYTLARLV